MPRFLLLKITLAWMLLTAAPLSAKVFTFTELNCHCEVPDTWVFQDTPDELVHVIDMEHARSFELLVKPVSRAITLDSKEFLSGFDQALIPQGFVPQDHREVVLDGIKFHEIHLTKDLGNKTLNYCAYITLADGYGYNIRIEAYNVDPEQDDELKAMVQSFAFIKPPKIHRGFSYWDMFNPPDPAQHDATSLANYRAGVTLGILAVLAIGLTIAVGITYGISSLEKEDEPASSSSSASTGTPAVPKPAEETKSIHILMTDGQQVVHEVGQVREMLQGGVLTPETFFWMEGMPEWRPLQELPPRRVATVVPPRRTGGASSSSPQSMQPTVLSQATTTPEILAPSSAVASVENETHSYQFRLIHRERFLRLVAAWLDFSLVFGPLIFLHFAGPYILTQDTGVARPNFTVFFLLGLYYIALIITQVVQALRSRSVGKSIFRLRVINYETELKSGFVANVCRLLTNGTFGLIPLVLFLHLPLYAVIWVVIYAFIDALVIFYNDRCIHDYLTGTTVVERRR